MMHTVVPRDVWEGKTSLPSRTIQPFSGGYAEFWPDGSLCRLISTDPALYLDPHFAPGGRPDLPAGP